MLAVNRVHISSCNASHYKCRDLHMYVCIMPCRLDKRILHLRSLEKRVMSIIMKRTMKSVYRFVLLVISTRILYYVYSLGT